MKKEIEWLIDRYGEKLEKCKEDFNIFGGQFRSGCIQVYEKVIEDLKGILESEAENDT